MPGLGVDPNGLCKTLPSYIFQTMCILCTPCPICWSTYRHIGPGVSRHIDRCLTDMLVDMATDRLVEMCRSTYQLTYQLRYRPIYGRHIDRIPADISLDIATDTRRICWPLIIGGISVNCQWSIGRLSYNISWKFIKIKITLMILEWQINVTIFEKLKITMI